MMRIEDELILLCSKDRLDKDDEEKIDSIFKNNLDIKYILKRLNSKTKEKFFNLIQQKRIKESLEIINFLNKNKINYVVLKGLTLWKFNKKRKFGDLDIFVDKKDVKKVMDLLIKKFDYDYDKKEFEFIKKNNFKFGHHIMLFHKNKIMIEIHYLLVNYALINNKSISLLSDKMYINVDRIKVPSFIPELQLINNILHNSYGHKFLGVNYHRWLDDMNLIINNNSIDWNKFIKLLCELECLEIIYRSIKILNNFSKTKTNIPQQVLKKIYFLSSKWILFKTNKFEAHFFKKYDNRIKKFLSSPNMMVLWNIKITLLFNTITNIQTLKAIYYSSFLYSLKKIFPPKEELSKRYKINEDSKLFYIFYIINWFRILSCLKYLFNRKNN